MNKKKLVVVLAALVAVLTIAIGGTLAYFTADDKAENVFTVGNVDIDLTEPKWEDGGKEEAKEAYPGEALAKDPTVKNTGKNPCFVRISVTGLDCLIKAELSAQEVALRTNYVVGALGEGWVEHEDGYFYYTKTLAAEESTTALFDSIVMPTDLINGDAVTEMKIDVLAEAVQAQGAKPSWSAVQAMTVAEIAAWFATCGL